MELKITSLKEKDILKMKIMLYLMDGFTKKIDPKSMITSRRVILLVYSMKKMSKEP